MKKILLCFAISVIIFLAGSVLLTKYAYSAFILVSPIRTISKLINYAKNTSDYSIRIQIYTKILLYMVAPQLLYLMILALLHNKNKVEIASEKERTTLKGSDQWLDTKTLIKNSVLHTWDNLPQFIFGASNDTRIDSSDPQNLSTTKIGKYVLGCNPEKQQIITIGGTRSYKGVSTIVPTLLQYSHSVIVYDPAKENYNITAGYRQKLGSVQFFNPQDKKSTLHFNPLDWIRHNGDFITSDIANITTIIIPDNPKTEALWIDNPRNLIAIYISYVILFMPLEKQNLKSAANIANIMNEPSIYNYHKVKERIEDLQKKIEVALNEKEKEKILNLIQRYTLYIESLTDDEKMIQDDEYYNINKIPSANSLLKRIANDINNELELLDRADKDSEWKLVLLLQTKSMINKIMVSSKAEATLASCITIADTAMQFFSEDSIARLMDKTTFNINDLQQNNNPISLYLCIPDVDTSRCKRFVQIFITCIVKHLTDDYRKNYKHHLLFILDEFPQLGRLKAVEESMVYSLKYHISFHLVVQSISQLQSDEAYGREQTKTILGNMSILDIKKVFDIDTAKWVSEMLGKKTLIFSNTTKNYKNMSLFNQGSNLSIKEEERQLMTPTEIINMPSDEEIVIIANKGAAKAKKLIYFQSILNTRANLPISNSKKEKEDYDDINQEFPSISEGNSFVNFLHLFESENSGFRIKKEENNTKTEEYSGEELDDLLN